VIKKNKATATFDEKKIHALMSFFLKSFLSEYIKHTVITIAFVVAIKKAKKPLITHQYFFSLA